MSRGDEFESETKISRARRRFRERDEDNDPLSLATDSGYVFFIILYIKNPYLDLEKNIVKWLRQCFFLTS